MRRLLLSWLLVCLVVTVGSAQKDRDRQHRGGPKPAESTAEIVVLHANLNNPEVSLYVQGGALAYGPVNPATPPAQWALQRLGDKGQFTLQSQATRQFLMVQNGQLALGNPQMDPATGAGPHVWSYGATSTEGTTITGWQIVNTQAGTFLHIGRDVRGGGTPTVVDNNSCYWNVVNVPTPTPPAARQPFQRLRNGLDGSQCIDLDGNTVICSDGTRGKGTDQWEVQELATRGTFALRNRATGQYLQVQGGQLVLGAAVPDPAGKTTDFEWQSPPSHRGVFLKNVKSGMHLVISQDHHSLLLEADGGPSKGYEWMLEPVTDDRR